MKIFHVFLALSPEMVPEPIILNRADMHLCRLCSPAQTSTNHELPADHLRPYRTQTTLDEGDPISPAGTL